MPSSSIDSRARRTRRHHPAHRRLGLGALPLDGGGAIEDLELSYVTHGRPGRAGRTVVVTTAIGSDHHRLDFLIGPGRALDPARDFIVAVDAIGNGRSTSPSTSRTQPGWSFPRFRIADMVEAQVRLVDALGIGRVDAVVGASMGGMQALEWAVRRRDRLASCVAITAMARTTAWSAAMNGLARELLTVGLPATAAPPRDRWPNARLLLDLIACRTPLAVLRELPGAPELAAWRASVAADWVESSMEPIDWIYQSLAYDAHDVGRSLGPGGTDAALRGIDVPVLLVAPRLDLYNPVTETERMADAIPDVEVVWLETDEGHAAASGRFPREAGRIDAAVREFLARVRSSGV